jgi:hypothetical protein
MIVLIPILLEMWEIQQCADVVYSGSEGISYADAVSWCSTVSRYPCIAQWLEMVQNAVAFA